MPDRLSGKSLLNMLGKEVHFILVDKSTVTGRVYTIDPETHNFILMTASSTTLLPFCNIAEFTLVSPDNRHDNDVTRSDDVTLSDLDQIDAQFFPHMTLNSTVTSAHSCEKLRNRLVEFMKEHRVPCEVRGEDVVIAGSVVCTPPYTADSCSSTNDIVLGRIQRVLGAMQDT